MDTKYYWTDEANGVVTVGLTPDGQNELGNITFVSIPKVGTTLSANDTLLNVEADKAVSDIPTPVAGKVVAINEKATDDPSVLNGKDKSESWIAKIQK
ncbi:glycine cleavage system protein H [Lentilactobacillus parafarraginis]|jgi:glycine cleavage system H protein|uniref:Glycine cleavage system H family protein n=2 Tax=Lentilactobacillus parafarraginis TaxID=390842 RepID=A0A0R1YU18_9LACO|nr:glycine cleavage system protein H [Lentilactobacillus parafarraginis]KRM43387.1 glycine cleavage system H family protein [Lentilactobacillus parafarraginis DSM 18390 = JCM 14109]TLQ20104.1 glycine cleavage system protein H [Lentilactobacillus parafarraginis]